MADTDAPPSTASGADRISTLPDCVREHVLSFLPAHEAVRTSMLARSWCDIWMGSPALNITGWGTFAKFSKFVLRMLHLRHDALFPRQHITSNGCAPLDSCRFSFGTYDFADEQVLIRGPLVNGWIQCALRCNVRTLQFCFDDSYVGRLSLPDLALASEHLTKLQLAGIAFFDSLDLSGCPVLRDLEIDDSFLLSEEICCPSLLHLSITMSDFEVMDRTRIRTPNLLSLKVTDCCGMTPVLGRMPSLSTAVVELHSSFIYDKCSAGSIHGCGRERCQACRYYGPHNDQTSCLILNGLSDATNLELTSSPDVIVFRRDIKCCPRFRNLKTLILADWFVADDFTGLIWFLQHSPILEKLTLQLSEMQKNSITTEERFKPCEQTVVSDHLKTIEIKCHEVNVMVVKILKILAASAIPLEQINIKSSTTESDCVNFKCTGFTSK